MSFQGIIVGIVVLGAAIYVGRIIFKATRGQGEEGCAGCSQKAAPRLKSPFSETKPQKPGA